MPRLGLGLGIGRTRLGAGGPPVPPNTLIARPGFFSLTGDSMIDAFAFGADQGAFSLSGQVVTFAQGTVPILSAAMGTFTLTGNAATLTGANNIAASEGAFALTGKAVGFGMAMPAAQGSFVMTGEAATLTAPSTFALAFGAMSSLNDSSHTTVDYGTTAYPSGATRIVIAIAWVPSAANTVAAVNIIGSGVTFTQIPGAYITVGGAAQSVDMWISSGPVSGSSGDVQITYTGHCGWESSIATYGLTTSSPTPGTAGTGSASGTTTTSASIVVPSGGGAIVVAAAGNAHTATFTNTLTPDATDTPIGGGYFVRTNSTGSISVVGTWSGNDSLVISAVPWAS